MQKIKLFILALVITTLSNNSIAASQKYKFDVIHTNILWHASHFGFSSPSGKFTDMEGEILFNEANPEKSSVNITIKTNSINTGIPKFDEHLRSPDFFNTKKFPTAKFVSDDIKITSKNRAKITGKFTMLGVTKPVTLNVKLNKSGLHPYSQKPTIGFTASTIIKRSEFGMKYAIPGISDKVKISIETEANLEQ